MSTSSSLSLGLLGLPWLWWQRIICSLRSVSYISAKTYGELAILGREHPQHVPHDRPDIVRLPLLLLICLLQVSHNVHDCLQTRAQHLLLILELHNKVGDVVDGALGFNAVFRLTEDGGDFFLSHDKVTSSHGIRSCRKCRTGHEGIGANGKEGKDSKSEHHFALG